MKNINIESNLYEDPQIKKLFQEEIKSKVPLEHLRAHFYFAHPSSYLYDLDEQSKTEIIRKDILKIQNFDFEESILQKIRNFTLTKSQRLLDSWQRKLEERDQFIQTISYSPSTYDMLDDMLSKSNKMWQEYLRILKQFSDDESQVHGGIEESFLEKNN